MQEDKQKNISEIEMKMPEEPFFYTEPTKSTLNTGPVIVIIIGLLLLILGGLILWSVYIIPDNEPVNIAPSVQRPTKEDNNEPESIKAEAQVETLGAVSISDEVFAIESDLQSTNVDELDAELQIIEAELGL